jgi:hypothetical protein
VSKNCQLLLLGSLPLALPPLFFDRAQIAHARGQTFCTVSQHNSGEEDSWGTGMRGVSCHRDWLARCDGARRPSVSGKAQETRHFYSPKDMLPGLIHDVNGHRRVRIDESELSDGALNRDRPTFIVDRRERMVSSGFARRRGVIANRKRMQRSVMAGPFLF